MVEEVLPKGVLYDGQYSSGIRGTEELIPIGLFPNSDSLTSSQMERVKTEGSATYEDPYVC